MTILWGEKWRNGPGGGNGESRDRLRSFGVSQQDVCLGDGLRRDAWGTGGDEELPVGGFEEEERAAELLQDSLAEGGAAPVAGGADLAGVELGGVDVGVGPGGLGVHPDVVVALGSPGALVH